MKKIIALIILSSVLCTSPSLADIGDTYTCVMTRADGPAIKTLQHFVFKRYETKLSFGNMPSGTYEPSYFRKGYVMEITDSFPDAVTEQQKRYRTNFWAEYRASNGAVIAMVEMSKNTDFVYAMFAKDSVDVIEAKCMITTL